MVYVLPVLKLVALRAYIAAVALWVTISVGMESQAVVAPAHEMAVLHILYRSYSVTCHAFHITVSVSSSPAYELTEGSVELLN